MAPNEKKMKSFLGRFHNSLTLFQMPGCDKKFWHFPWAAKSKIEKSWNSWWVWLKKALKLLRAFWLVNTIRAFDWLANQHQFNSSPEAWFCELPVFIMGNCIYFGSVAFIFSEFSLALLKRIPRFFIQCCQTSVYIGDYLFRFSINLIVSANQSPGCYSQWGALKTRLSPTQSGHRFFSKEILLILRCMLQLPKKSVLVLLLSLTMTQFADCSQLHL